MMVSDFLIRVFSEYHKKINPNEPSTKVEKMEVEKIIQKEPEMVSQPIIQKIIQISPEEIGNKEYQEAIDYRKLKLITFEVGERRVLKESAQDESSIFVDEEDGVKIVTRKLDKDLGSYSVIEIPMGEYDKEIARRIIATSYLGHIDLTNKSLNELYYTIKQIVKNYYSSNRIKDIDNSLIKVSYYILKELTYKNVTPFFFDGLIEDINGVENNYITIYYAGKIDSKREVDFSGDYITNIKLSKDEIDEIIRLFVERGNDSITKQMRVKSVTLPTADKSRFTAIYPYETGGNMAFSIRKQVYNLLPPNVFIANKTATADELAFIAWAMDHVETGKIAIIGLPAAGKTTFLKTISFFIPATARVFSIETTPEIYLTQKSWTRQINVTDINQQIKLVNASLMFRPDFMIIGELKLDKSLADSLFSVMASGERTLFTFHATSPAQFISKFQARSLEISKDRLANLSYILFVTLDPVTHVRYLASIDEIYDYDDEHERVLWKNLTTTNLRVKGYNKETKKREIVLVFDTKFGQAGSKYVDFNTYVKFIQKAELNTGPLDIIKNPDQLLIMLLNSKLIERYVYIHNNDLELEQVFNEDGSLNYPLTYWKMYKQIYNEMKAIRTFLINETINDVDIEKFLKDYNLFYNSTHS
jgi:type IV secretory pathway ATPase VirB11/archaellum biosynthesis ATPase